jgi:hypothetical protein
MRPDLEMLSLLQVLRDRRARRAFAVGVVALLGCSGDPSEGERNEPSGATCPPNSALTYDNFGRAFMDAYCTRCHSSMLQGAERNGAPSDHDFDTLLWLRATDTRHIDEMAAAGPAHVNTAMPPSDPRPSTSEREQLGEWLACEMP